MAKITWKAGTLLSPLPPALISCGTMKNPNVMTAAWTGIICTEPTLVYVSVRPSRYSNELIRETKEFVINVPSVELAKAVDFCGVKSGRDVNKFKEAGITPAKCSAISAPQVEEAPISLQCRVKDITSFGTHDMFLAEVLAVDVDEKYINEKGALDLNKAHLLAYAHGFYYALGEQLGKFGWSVEKDKKEQQKNQNKIKKALAVHKTKSLKKTETEKNAKFVKKSKKTDVKKNSDGARKFKKNSVAKANDINKIIYHKPIKKRVVVFK